MSVVVEISAGSAHRCGPGRPTRQHLRYCSAADASMVDRHCEANNPASYASVVTVAVVWGASLALSLMPVRFPRLGQMPSGSPSSPTSAMEAGSRHMVESGVDRTQTDAFCFSSSRAVPATHFTSPSTASTQCLIDPPAVRQQRLQTGLRLTGILH